MSSRAFWAEVDANWRNMIGGISDNIGASSVHLDALNALTGQKASAIWGQPIPITWGQFKYTVPLLQIGGLTRKQTGYSEIINEGSGWQTRSGMFFFEYTNTVALALGYNFGPKKFVARIYRNNQKIYDYTSTSLTQQKFALYQCSEDHVPDPALEHWFSHQVPYNGLMYLVLYDYVIGNNADAGPFQAIGQAGNGYRWDFNYPSFAVELMDNENVPTPKTTYTVPSGYTGTSSNSTALYDYYNHFIYTVDGEKRTVEKWNVSSQSLVTTYGMSNFEVFDRTLRIGGQPESNWGNAYSTVAGARGLVMGTVKGSLYGVFRVNLDNSAVIGCMDMLTGRWTDHHGLQDYFGFAGNNDPNGRMMSPPDNVQPFYTGTAGCKRSYVLCHTLNAGAGQGYMIFKVCDEVEGKSGTLLPVLGATGTDYYTDIVGGGEGTTSFSGDTTFIVRRVKDGVQKLEWMTVTRDGRFAFASIENYAPLYPVVAMFRAADEGIVLFEDSGSQHRIVKYDPGSKKVVWTKTDIPMPGTDGLNPWRSSFTAGQKIGWITGIAGNQKAIRMSLINGDWSSMPMTTNTGFGYGNQPLYDALDDKFMGIEAGIVKDVNVGPNTVNRVPLSSILKGLCLAAGMPEDKIWIVGIDDLVNGAFSPATFNLRQVLSDIGACYGFSVIDHDDGIMMVRTDPDNPALGGLWDIYPEDRVLLEGSDGGGDIHSSIKSTRAMDQNVPSKITINYIDPALDYTLGSYTYTRPDQVTKSTAAATYTLPLIMTADDASALAMKMTYAGVEARTKHVLRLSQKFLGVEPGDLLRIHRDGYVDLAKVNTATVNGDWSVDIDAQGIGSNIVKSIGTDAPVQVRGDKLTGDGTSAMFILDVPARSLADAVNGMCPQYYALINAARGAWPGAQAYRGADISSLQSVGTASTEMVTGRIASAVPNTNWLGIDRLSTITLNVLTGDKTTFASVTTEQMLAGANRVYIGDTGRWELIGFETATQNADGTVTLSGILRGLGGTDQNCGLHQDHDTFILVSTDLVGDLLPMDKTGSNFTYVACGGALKPEMQSRKIVTFNGNGRKPLAPINVHATKSGSDLVLSWTPRARSGYTLRDGETTPFIIDEAVEAYTAQVLAPDGTVLRTFSVGDATATYLAADIATDFGALPTTLRIKVWQVGDNDLAGFARDVVVDL